MQHVFLIDGSGFIFRAFHALPPMTRPDGTPVNAVYGFTTMILKLIEDTDADHIAVVFDTARRTFRNDIYPDYKAQRPPPPEALIPQFALVRQAARAFNVAQVEMEGYEADDLIATYACLAHEKGAKVTIVSSDKDLMQLVGDGITLYDAMRNRVIGPDEVREKFGVGPERVIDVQALAGDASDNVPGIRGIGVKTAAQLIAEFGDLDTLLARAAEVKAEADRSARTVYAVLNERLDHLARSADFPAALTHDLHVLPYFHGNRSPRADPTLKGVVSGLRLSDTIDDLALLYLATIQAVAHGTRHIIDAMNANGYAIETVFACGGGTKNPLFLREHADITGCRIVLPREPEAVLLGSAILGAVAAGDFGSVLAAMSAMNRAGDILVPATGRVAGFHAAKQRVFQRMHADFLAYRQIMAG